MCKRTKSAGDQIFFSPTVYVLTDAEECKLLTNKRTVLLTCDLHKHSLVHFAVLPCESAPNQEENAKLYPIKVPVLEQSKQSTGLKKPLDSSWHDPFENSLELWWLNSKACDECYKHYALEKQPFWSDFWRDVNSCLIGTRTIQQRRNETASIFGGGGTGSERGWHIFTQSAGSTSSTLLERQNLSTNMCWRAHSERIVMSRTSVLWKKN